MDPLQVLVVDDDRDIAELVRQRLLLDDPETFQVRTVSDRFERLCIPGAWYDVDVLVLDLWLTPTGFREEYPMAHRIMACAHAEKPDLPVIIFSAVVGLQRSPDLEREAEMTLSKPSIDRITDAVLTVTHQRRHTDQ